MGGRLRTPAAIEADITRIKGRLRELQAELFDAQCELAGLHVGDIVQSVELGEVLVTKIHFHGITYGLGTFPSIMGRKRKKNGEWAERSQHVFGGWSK